MTINKLLICGGRNFTDCDKLKTAIKNIPCKPLLIIEGGATGADNLAKRYAILNGIHYAEIPVLWDYFGVSAGRLRNEAMLLIKPDYCLAMPGGAGTKNMVDKCSVLLIPVWRPYG